MKEISQAFVKAQREFGPALKTSDNPFFKSKYADLSVCIEAVIDALNNNDIALIQNCHECQDGVMVETIFLHSSGDQLSTGKLHVPASKQDPQGYGSALTYARRYSLMAACGIAPEDDDGNAARKADGSKNGNYKPAANVLGNKPYKMKEGCSVTEERMGHVEDIIERIMRWVKDKKWTDAVLEFDNAILEGEEKLFVWSFLDSTQRAAIKKEDEAQRAKYSKQKEQA